VLFGGQVMLLTTSVAGFGSAPTAPAGSDLPPAPS
jgi:hypothetical protein